MHKEIDLHYLKLALDLAIQKRGFCSPNPAVGAIIIDNQGNILARGYHNGAGCAHAEIEALKQLSHIPPGSTLYVTLEPCCHWGKTPPCTDAIMQTNIKRVVFGYKDPNPIVFGKGVKQLAEAGIIVEHVVLPEITEFYQSYDYWQRQRKPFVTAKIALSLNGKIAAENGNPMQITGDEAARLTHVKRKLSDALLTTANTIRLDNPQLNARCEGEVIAKPVYILDRTLSIDPNAKIFTTAKTVTLFHSPLCPAKVVQHYIELGAICVPIKEEADGLSLSQVMEYIGQQGIHDLWIEAGGKLLTSLLKNKILHRLFIYIAPKWIANGYSAFDEKLVFDMDKTSVNWKSYGKDVVGQFEFI